MTFRSLLFLDDGSTGPPAHEPPSFFQDLNLDQIVGHLVSGRESYDLTPLFFEAHTTIQDIQYRHEIMRDLQDPETLKPIRAFAGRLVEMREHLAQVEALHYERQRQAWFRDAVAIYCNAVEVLASDLTVSKGLKARGLQAFRSALVDYVGSEAFRTVVRDVKAVAAALSSVQYALHLKGHAITVRHYEGEEDLGPLVADTFERFRRRTSAMDYRAKFSHAPAMNHVEARILDLVASLYPEAFTALAEFTTRYESRYADAGILQFDREVQFYLAYLDLMERLQRRGLPFCYPEILTNSKETRDEDAFDLALALRLEEVNQHPVLNSWYLKDPERIFIVSGPNQGGKTTFARMLGQVHYLAKLGLPVPGRHARVAWVDHIFTHFPREEEAGSEQGRLLDDLSRAHQILNQMSGESLLLFNEIFSSTTLKDALQLGRQILASIIEQDALAVVVTFIEEWASLSEKTVSWVSAVDPKDPAIRTFKIGRRSPDGRSYAMTIAEKYGLTPQRIRERIGS